MRTSALVFTGLFSAILAGCDFEIGWFNVGKPDDSQLTLGVTDAPADSATKVVIAFTGVAFQDKDGEWQRFDLEPPRQIDLLAQQGKRELLLDNVLLKPDQYRFIQLFINSNGADSYVVLDLDENPSFPLRLPDDGLPFGLNTDFTMPSSGKLDLTIDIDLRRGLSGSAGTGSFEIQPAMRLINTDNSGTITGSVAADLLKNNCARPEGQFIYVFSGKEARVTEMLNNEDGPLTSVQLTPATSNSPASYRLDFLPAGDYTLAFTCEGDRDQPLSDDGIEFSRNLVNVTVIAGKTSSANFIAR